MNSLELARVLDEDVWYVYRDGRPHGGSIRDPNDADATETSVAADQPSRDPARA